MAPGDTPRRRIGPERVEGNTLALLVLEQPGAHPLT